MREEYFGREISVAALNPVLDMLGGTDKLEFVRERVPPHTDRISWQTMCEILDHYLLTPTEAQRIGTLSVKSRSYPYRGRFRFVGRVFELEQILRLIIYPRNPIDFACASHAVATRSDGVDLLIYINARYHPNKNFFAIIEGAAREFMRLMNLPDGHVTMVCHGAQARISFNYQKETGLRTAIRRVGSRTIGSWVLRRIALQGYPDLVAGRKAFEDQLIERAQIEEQLLDAKRNLHNRMLAVDDVIAEIDADGILVYVSPNAHRLLGFTIPMATAELLKIVHAGDSPRVHRQIKAALETGDTCRIDDFRFSDPGGTTRWAEIDFRSLENESSRTIAVARDVTERRHRDSERARIDRELEKIQRLDVLGVLAGGIAHDLNNWLVPILGQAELARLELDEKSPIQARLDTIRHSAVKTAELVRQLSIFAGGVPPNVQAVDLRSEITHIFDSADQTIPAHIAVRKTLKSDVRIQGDALQLRQATSSLLINAVEAIGENGGTINVTVREHNGLVEIVVADDGCGMDEWKSARATEPFYTTKFAGRGLGLSVVVGIVRAHDGRLSVKSRVDQGTEVTMSFPALSSNAAVEGLLKDDSAGRFSGAALIVDDDPEVLWILREFMTNFGFEVDTASNGASAIEMSSVGNYSIIILDLVMPGVDGREVLAAVRRQTPKLPVILVSGFGISSLNYDFGIDRYTKFIHKPVKVEDLGRLLYSLIQRSKIESDASKLLSG